MTTPTVCVFDLPVPRRCGIDDVGGGAKEDDQAYPPNPVTMATGADMNQWQQLLVRYGAVLPAAIVTVYVLGGVPAIAKVTHVKDSSFTVSDLTLTANGTGDIAITWAASTFPPITADHDAVLIGNLAGSATTSTMTHGAQVFTFDASGTPAHRSFQLRIYGD